MQTQPVGADGWLSQTDVLITGIGLTASTYSISKRLHINKPDLVIQAGVAGCFSKNIPLGGVVAVKQDTIADQSVIELNELKTLFDLKLVPQNMFPFSKGWLVNPELAIYSIAIMATWKNLGLYVILFLVGLQTVPVQYYEAAKMEGATSWQRFWHITLPMINPTIFLVVVLSTIGGFSLFIEPYIMTGGGPLNKTLSAVLYIYKQAFQYYNMGYSATLGFFYALMIMTVVVLQKKFIEKEG